MRRSKLSLAVAGAAVAVSAATPPLFAQDGLRFSASAIGGEMRVHSTTSTANEALSGGALGVEAMVGLGWVRLQLRYLGAQLSHANTKSRDRRVAEGEALLGLHPFRWLGVWTGVHGRSHRTSFGTNRWVLWEVRGRSELGIAAEVFTGYAEGWAVVRAVEIPDDVTEPWDSGQGGEIGLRLALPGFPLWARAAYRIELYKLGGGTHQELTDGLVVALGLGGR